MANDEWRFVLTLSGAHSMSHVFRRLLPPLIPVLALAYGYQLWELGLIVGAFSLGSGLGQTPLGMLSDRHDRRLLISAGIALVGACYVGFTLTPLLGNGVVGHLGGVAVDAQFAGMVVVMFVGGIGTSALHPTGYPLMTANVDPSRKGKAFGAFGSAAKLGDGVAPLAIGILLLWTGWRTILLLIGAFGIVYAVGLYVVLGRYRTRPLARPPSEPGTDDAVSVWRQDRRRYVYPLLAMFCFFAVRMVATGGVNVFIPQFITSVYGYSFSVLGVAVTPTSTASFFYSALLITAGITQLGTGELVDRFDGRLVLLAFLAAGTAMLLVLGFVYLGPGLLFVVLILLGGSLWGMNPARDAIISQISPTDREGRTFGYLWTGAMVIGSVSPVFIGYLGEVAGLQSAFQLLAVVTVLSMVPIASLFSDRVYLASPRPSEASGSD